jgi:hypothetical protein
MFKKTLLAVSILGTASFAANAGQLTASVKEITALVSDFNAAVPSTCTAAAAALGVTLNLDGNSLTGGTETVNDATGTDVANAFDQGTNSVTLVADDECDVVYAADELFQLLQLPTR